jgi:hypothetical protein
MKFNYGAGAGSDLGIEEERVQEAGLGIQNRRKISRGEEALAAAHAATWDRVKRMDDLASGDRSGGGGDCWRGVCVEEKSRGGEERLTV